MAYDDGRDAWRCGRCDFLGPNESSCPLPGTNVKLWSDEDRERYHDSPASQRMATQRLMSRFKHAKDALRLAARFKEKKKNPNGGDPIYLYSEKQVAERNKAKADRLEKLSGNIHKLRAQVKKDLKSDDVTTSLTALAVALMDETAERVGNETSKEGDNEDGKPHFGVTTWQKSHVSFGKGKATIKYTGKSGVKQEKTVTDGSIVSALKKAYDSCKDGDIFCHEESRVDASKVNSYLKDFDITAKDIRGFHANDGMKTSLKKVRSAGGKLPEDKKEREAKLKKEFTEALEEVAGELGHEPSTLKNQYLVPGLEEAYMKDGTILSGMKAANLVARFRAEAR